MTFKEINERFEKFLAELEDESRLNWAGLKDESNTEPIMKKYEDLFSKDNISLIEELWKAESDSAKKYEYKLLFFGLIDMNIYFNQAKSADEISSYLSKSKVKFKKKEISYYDIRPTIMKTDDFNEREILQKLAVKVVKEINPKILKSLLDELKELENFGFQSYIKYYSDQKSMDYERFYRLSKKIFSRLQNLYLAKMGKIVEERLDKKLGEIKSCHSIYLLQMRDYQQLFPKDKLIEAYKLTIKDMGLDDLESKNIHIDIEDRPTKNPRAVCFTVQVPKEIHLIIKPNGGQQDFEALMHEAGHSQHFAHIDPNLPFSFRNLSSSHALTELFSYIFEGLSRNPYWLSHYLGIDEKIGTKLLMETETINLFMLIRYLGKFIYEYEVFENNLLDQAPRIYTETLKDFTGFVYDQSQFLNDMDSGFYSADYLRAWLGEAQLSDYLEINFSKNWFMNKEAGHFLKELWLPGFQSELESVIENNNIGQGFDIEPLIRKFESILK